MKFLEKLSNRLQTLRMVTFTNRKMLLPKCGSDVRAALRRAHGRCRPMHSQHPA
jgi:hypothetical protein